MWEKANRNRGSQLREQWAAHKAKGAHQFIPGLSILLAWESWKEAAAERAAHWPGHFRETAAFTHLKTRYWFFLQSRRGKYSHLRVRVDRVSPLKERKKIGNGNISLISFNYLNTPLTTQKSFVLLFSRSPKSEHVIGCSFRNSCIYSAQLLRAFQHPQHPTNLQPLDSWTAHVALIMMHLKDWRGGLVLDQISWNQRHWSPSFPNLVTLLGLNSCSSSRDEPLLWKSFLFYTLSQAKKKIKEAS